MNVADRRVGFDDGGSSAAISGGEREDYVAVELARAPEPRVLAADEPTTGLDGVSAEKVIRALKEQARFRQHCCGRLITSAVLENLVDSTSMLLSCWRRAARSRTPGARRTSHAS